MASQDDNSDSLGLVYKHALNGTSNVSTPKNVLFWGDFPEVRQPVYGFLFPAVAGITVFTNVIVCIVLMKKLNPVNMLLTAISVFDLITVLVSQPMLLYYFTFNNIDWVPYEWCMTFKLTLMYVPSTAHITSLWLTVFMAAQRYYIVRKPFMSFLITIRKTFGLIVVAFFIGLSVNFLRFFDSYFIPVTISSLKNTEVDMTGCVEVTEPWITNPSEYFSIYFIVRATVQSYIPSLVLLVLNALLIYEMRAAQKRRRSFNNGSGAPSHQERAVETANKRTTMMLIAVVASTTCSEIPTAIVFSVLILSLQMGIQLIDPLNMGIAVIVVDVLVLLSYPMNFVLYCCISSNFRTAFRTLFCPWATAPRNKKTVNKTDSSATSVLNLSRTLSSEAESARNESDRM